MAFSLKRTSAPAPVPVGLDLDGGYISAVQAADGAIMSAVAEDLPPGLVVDGEVADVEGLSEVLESFFGRHNLPKRVRLGVANQQIVVRQIELPLIEDARERQAAVRFQAAETIAMPLEETILDYQLLGESSQPDGSAGVRAIVVAAREAMIDRFVAAARGAGLKPEGIDLDAFALVRVLARPLEGETTAHVHCHLAEVANLAVAFGDACLFARPLSTAWTGGTDDPAATLAEEIRFSIDFYVAQPESPRIGEVVLSGPGARRRGLADELAGLIGMPVTVANPLGELIPSPSMRGDQERHTVAAGLALGAAA